MGVQGPWQRRYVGPIDLFERPWDTDRDLGCGCLALMAPVFTALPLGSYAGVDLTEQVLPLAREAPVRAG